MKIEDLLEIVRQIWNVLDLRLFVWFILAGLGLRGLRVWTDREEKKKIFEEQWDYVEQFLSEEEKKEIEELKNADYKSVYYPEQVKK